MPEENKKTNEAPAKQSELAERDMENISGGLWGITILDSCQGRFYKEICETSLFGNCPHLIVVNKTKNYKAAQMIETITTYSCSKGCFNKTQIICIEEC